jgi:hypothetical protein
MNASLTAIGRQLQADYAPVAGTPLPRELNDLLARLVALEASTRAPTERSVDVLETAIAQPRTRS